MIAKYNMQNSCECLSKESTCPLVTIFGIQANPLLLPHLRKAFPIICCGQILNLWMNFFACCQIIVYMQRSGMCCLIQCAHVSLCVASVALINISTLFMFRFLINMSMTPNAKRNNMVLKTFCIFFIF